MTSSKSALNTSNNHKHLASSLPSPPISHYYHHSLSSNIDNKKMPTFTVDRAPLPYRTTCNGGGGDRSGLLSDMRYTGINNRHRDFAELRPFLFNPVSDNNDDGSKFYLPPIQNVIMATPTSSPSPSFDNYYGTSSASPISSIASSPTPVDEEEGLDNLDQPQKQHQEMINVRRKGSIASLLNSAPELKQLDEEESKCNYLSHFIDNCGSTDTPIFHYQQTSLKRGRPRQDHTEIIYDNPTIKKQRKSSNHNLDCVQQQACQSSSQVMPTALPSTITNDSPRATKGLRHFSKQVCDKVAEKGITTYNEVADELALDIQNAALENEKQIYDQKNIRRRVYDALNVLMAMNIIAKDKKVIKWLGIPDCYKQQTNHENNKYNEVKNKQVEIEEVLEQKSEVDDASRHLLLKQIEQEELRQKELLNSLMLLREGIHSKLAKHLQIRNLVRRNQQQIKQKNEKDDENSSRISLPFFIIACPTAQVTNIVNDSRSVVISIHHENQHDSNKKIIYEDSEVLQHLHLNNDDPSATRS